MFSPEQKEMLAAKLDSSHVKKRAQAGRQLSYVEGWFAISEANRIFGFDGWTRETVEIRCVSERERKIGKEPNTRDGWGVSYIARVRVTVGEIVREGVGSGHGIDVDPGQAHESAIKEAETDAMKRALMTFGNPFGLALYDKEQANVETIKQPDGKTMFIGRAKELIAAFGDAQGLADWWGGDDQKKARRDFDLTQEDVTELKNLVLKRIDALGGLKKKEAA